MPIPLMPPTTGQTSTKDGVPESLETPPNPNRGASKRGIAPIEAIQASAIARRLRAGPRKVTNPRHASQTLSQHDIEEFNRLPTQEKMKRTEQAAVNYYNSMASQPGGLQKLGVQSMEEYVGKVLGPSTGWHPQHGFWPPTTNLLSEAEDVLNAWDEDKHPRDPHGRFAGLGTFISRIKGLDRVGLTPEEKARVKRSDPKGLFSKLDQGVQDISSSISKGIKGAFSSAKSAILLPFKGRPTNVVGQTREDFHSIINPKYYLVEATSHLIKAGVKGGLSEDLAKSVSLRSMAVNNPDKFDTLITKVGYSLAKSNRASQTKAMTREEHTDHINYTGAKLAQLHSLKAQANAFRQKHMPEHAKPDTGPFELVMPTESSSRIGPKPVAHVDDVQVLPDHYARRGASQINIAHAMDHLNDEGSPKSAVKYVMEKAGVLESTAKRYVRQAIKKTAEEVNKQIAQIKRSTPPERLKVANVVGITTNDRLSDLRATQLQLQNMLNDTEGWDNVDKKAIEDFVHSKGEYEHFVPVDPMTGITVVEGTQHVSNFAQLVQNWCNQYGGTTCKDPSKNNWTPKEKGTKDGGEPKRPRTGSRSGKADADTARAGGSVEGATKRPDDTAGSKKRTVEDKPTRIKAAKVIPATVEEASAKIDRMANFFRKKGQGEAADWMYMLKEHVQEHGVKDSLKALGKDVGNGDNKITQYEGKADDMSAFAEAYLNKHGIVPISPGAKNDLSQRLISGQAPMFGPQSRKDPIFADDFNPKDPTFKDKLEESKHLPGLKKSEDVSKLLGEQVTHLTPEVMTRLDKVYGKDKWIVKAYGGDAFAGYGIHFPQRARQLHEDAKATIADSAKTLDKYGFSYLRGDDGKIVGIKHNDGEEYKFLTNKYSNTIYGDVKKAGDAAFRVRENEKGAGLLNNHGFADGKEYMAQPAFNVVGVSEADRAAGTTIAPGEGRVHLATKDGKVSIIPHTTWIKGEHLPVVFENKETKAMAKAAIDAIKKLPASERQGQIYGPDLVKTTTGYKMVEANPANESGSSGYLSDNPFIIDSYVSHLTNRTPAHVRFIKQLLTTKEQPKPSKKKITSNFASLVANWCNQYGGTTCKEGSRGYIAQKKKDADKANKKEISKPEVKPKPVESRQEDVVPPVVDVQNKGSLFIKSLSEQDVLALKNYTNKDHKALNSAMRRCPPKFECLQNYDKYLYTKLESILEKAPKFKEPVSVYRGLDLPEDKANSFMGTFKSLGDKKFTLPSITSTTIDADVAKEFTMVSPGHDRLPVVFHIKAKSGLYVDSISHHGARKVGSKIIKGEQEVLVSSKTKYKVDKVEGNVIHMQEV